MTPCPASPISSSRRWSARSAMAPATGLISTPAIVASSVQVTAAEPDGITSSTSATRLAPEPADEIALLSQRYRKRGRSRRMLTDPRVSGRVSWHSNFGLSRNEGPLRPRQRQGDARVPLIMRVHSADLLQCRFAVSPLTETTDALRSIARFGAEGYTRAWQRQVRPRLPGLRLEPLLAILSWSGYQPDFLAPAPDSPFSGREA